VEVGGLLVSAPHDPALAIADTGVAWRAVDIEALPAALQDSHGYWKGKAITLLSTAHPSQKIASRLLLPACHGPSHLISPRPAIREECGAAQGYKLRLILHILPATG